MGFTTGFLGGLTLTTTVVYLTVVTHRTNRYHQALMLRQQSLVLNHIVDPQPPGPPPVNRVARSGLIETAKDKWNKELEENWRRFLNTDWRAGAEKAEDVLVAIWRRASASIKDKTQ